MKVQIHTCIEEISAQKWNALVRDQQPFLRHEFLQAMEGNGCVGATYGWLPRHLAIYDGSALVAAMPLYEKHNSYGEFVFDHAWASAYQRAGLAYYPKLVSAVPYTPATGQRLLCAVQRQQELFPLLLDAVLQLTRRIGASGFHCLFPADPEQRYMEQRGLLSRHDCQFHWHNHGYACFDEFLQRLTAKKRKNIRQERRRVAESGVSLRRLDGYTASDADWQAFARFYNRTFEQKWGVATFNLDFFRQVARQLPDRVVLVLADLDGACVAGSLMYRSDTTLYGRHWGCSEQVDCLHFEACYYQGIEYCIEQGLHRFEPGAQGEHKIARGFLPTLTRSSHWLVDASFRQPIRAYVEHEQAAIADYIEQLRGATPFRQDALR